MAVSHGQTEAARASGLRGGHVLRLVVLPQALRVIIPPLSSEYLNITKNSSLAVAIGFADLVAVGNNVLNPTGQSIEVVAIWMAFYLGLQRHHLGRDELVQRAHRADGTIGARR